eukprot:scaffold2636_cov340-Pavlova_lutheri.AAC.30
MVPSKIWPQLFHLYSTSFQISRWVTDDIFGASKLSCIDPERTSVEYGVDKNCNSRTQYGPSKHVRPEVSVINDPRKADEGCKEVRNEHEADLPRLSSAIVWFGSTEQPKRQESQACEGPAGMSARKRPPHIVEVMFIRGSAQRLPVF